MQYALLFLFILAIAIANISIMLLYTDKSPVGLQNYPNSFNICLDVFKRNLMIDHSPRKSEGEQMEKLEKQLPNLPLMYMLLHNRHFHHKNKTCAKFPTIFYDMNFNNVHWQKMDTSNGTFYLYGAYLDVRRNNLLGPTVRILAMINRWKPTVKSFCQLWFDGTQEPVVSKVLEYIYMFMDVVKRGDRDRAVQPYMLSCQMPQTHWNKVPVSVSIVEKVCDTASNNLRVIYNKMAEGQQHKKSFAVCVKGLAFTNEDRSVRLIEWFELLRLVGADKIFLYNLGVHPNISKVLNYYETKGYIDVRPISLPGGQPNIQPLQQLYLQYVLYNQLFTEMIHYNDCLYRNMYLYDYIALLDIDEVILPIAQGNWSVLMEQLHKLDNEGQKKNTASYVFRNVYFLTDFLEAHRKSGTMAPGLNDIPDYMHMLQHVYRSTNHSNPMQYVKCFQNPKEVAIVHNHHPLVCLGGNCLNYPVDPLVAHLQHYKTHAPSYAKQYANANVIDTTLWNYKEPLIKATKQVMYDLGFLKTI